MDQKGKTKSKIGLKRRNTKNCKTKMCSGRGVFIYLQCTLKEIDVFSGISLSLTHSYTPVSEFDDVLDKVNPNATPSIPATDAKEINQWIHIKGFNVLMLCSHT